MYIEKNYLSKAYRERISKLLIIILIILFIFIFFAFWNIQILKHNNFKIQALRNINKTLDLIAPRGLILGDKGKIITENKINFTLVLRKESIKDITRTLGFISQITKESYEVLEKRFNKYENYPNSFEIPIIKNLNLKDVILFRSQEEEYPEIKITIKPMRAYPLGNHLSHVIGYISELSPNELKSNKDYKLGDMIGKTGIEKEYEGYFVEPRDF